MKKAKFQFVKIIYPLLWIYGISVILTIGTSFASLYPAYVFKEIYDYVLPKGDFARLLYLVIMLGIVYLIISIATVINSYATNYANAGSHNRLRLALMRTVLSIPYRSLEQFGSGQLLGRFQSDLGSVAAWISIFLGTIASSVATFISVSSFIYVLDVRLLIGIIIIIPIYALVNIAFKDLIFNQAMKVQQYDAAVLHRLEDLFRGVRDMALAFTSRPFEKWLDESQRNAFSATMRMTIISSGANAIANLISALGPLCLLCYGGYLVINKQITMGTLIAFMTVVNRPFQVVSTLFSLRMQQFTLRASVKRIEELLGNVKENPLLIGSFEADESTLNVDSVTIKYGDRTILDNVNINIPKGSMCVITGPNGAGKSTLMEVLAGLQFTAYGSVSLGEKLLSEIPREILRKNIALVPQKPHIFDMTLFHNLVCNDEKYDMADLEKAMEVAGLTDGVSRFSIKDLNSTFGATGRVPSGGEVHRIALVRALMLNPKVLILDETFSSLPMKSEDEILNKLREYNKEMTIIVVSHHHKGLVDSHYDMEVKIGLDGKVESNSLSLKPKTL